MLVFLLEVNIPEQTHTHTHIVQFVSICVFKSRSLWLVCVVALVALRVCCAHASVFRVVVALVFSLAACVYCSLVCVCALIWFGPK